MPRHCIGAVHIHGDICASVKSAFLGNLQVFVHSRSYSLANRACFAFCLIFLSVIQPCAIQALRLIAVV